MHKHNTKTPNIGKPSLVAGVALLIMAMLAGYANFGVLQRLENGSDTPYNFSNSIGSVRVAIACFILVAILDVVVALALYRVLTPVQKSLSKLASICRVVYAGVFMIAISRLVEISSARGGDAYAKYVQDGFSGDYLTSIQNNVDAFHMIWSAALVIFGVHLLLIGSLAYRSNYMPRFLGVFIVVAGLGYLIDNLGTLYVSNYTANVSAVTFIGEVMLMLWLLIKGRRMNTTSRAA